MTDFLAEYCLIELVRHFQQRRRFQELKTWSQVRQGTVLRSRFNYILGADWCHFDIVGIQDMRNYTSDHFAIGSRILQRPTHCNSRYLWVSRAFPLKLLPTAEFSRVDANFQTLKNLEPVPPKLKHPPCPLWMSSDYIRFIDKHAALRWNPRHNRNLARGLTRAV